VYVPSFHFIGQSSPTGGNLYTDFLGIISTPSSWFNASLWTVYHSVPSYNDTVLIDDPYNTYIYINDGDAQAATVILGANTAADTDTAAATCATSVQLDVADTLSVETNLILAETADSDALLYVQESGIVHVYGDMIVGDRGSGIVMNNGMISVSGKLVIGQDVVSAVGTMHVSGKVYANELDIPNGNGRIQMSPGANIVVPNDQTNTLQAFIENGKVVPSDASGGLIYAVFDCTRNTTIVHASYPYVAETETSETRRQRALLF
jgi:hypothetical protein